MSITHLPTTEQKDVFQRIAHEALQRVPSYVSRFSFLRDCIRDGLLIEEEAVNEEAVQHEETQHTQREMSTAKIRAVLKEVAA